MKLVILFLLTLLSINCTAQTVEQIIEKHITAIGGSEACKKLNNYKIEGKSTVMLQEVGVVMYKKYQKTRQEISMMGMNMVTGYNGTSAWMINPLSGNDSAVVLDDSESAGLAQNNIFDNNLLSYINNGYLVQLLPKETIDKTNCFVIQLTKTNKATEVYYINTATFLITQINVTVNINGKTTLTKLNYADYKKEGDLLMPHTIFMLMGEMKITKVTFETQLNDALFEVPTAK
ncbi:MAG: hypothetical protein H7331_02015 [Bacteroidia bacterium]|nr:hypothetical protein [Bacteroidia bacterium]